MKISKGNASSFQSTHNLHTMTFDSIAEDAVGNLYVAVGEKWYKIESSRFELVRNSSAIAVRKAVPGTTITLEAE